MPDGKPHHRSVDITGQQFGYLTALRYEGSDGRKSFWRVRCQCGSEVVRVASELKKGNTRSCGCMRGRLRLERTKTHGMTTHKAFAVWQSMLDRCHLPSHRAYRNYGGRGIHVCAEWRGSFSTFWRDMGPSYQEGLTIDRRDNSAGYSKENCRWVDRRTQARNTRANRTIDTPAGPMLLIEAAEHSGINATTIAYRLDAGWPTSRLFDPPDFTNRCSI
jgi:hypothetical protein